MDDFSGLFGYNKTLTLSAGMLDFSFENSIDLELHRNYVVPALK
ncbi:hypothetical protein AVEN_10718-1, partial [Araneus ventricosus]